MPRPLRIEYKDAYYHVMNRGRGRQTIFHDESYFEAFLATLEEAHQRFGIQILCYCLMSNHYHLFIKTPRANLGRAMHHINGLYTQRYNRLKKTDGALFRGRYKAVCVEVDSYALQLSRYIHRNPVEAKRVNKLERYTWSSYPNYVGNIKPPVWLYRDEIYGLLGFKSKLKEKYKAFVELGVDEEIKQFYGKGNLSPYLGGDKFRKKLIKQRKTNESALSNTTKRHFRPRMSEVIEKVANVFDVEVNSISESRRGRVPDNIPRWVALYLSQVSCGYLLKEISKEFGLKRTGSIPNTIMKLKVLMNEDQMLSRKVERLMRQYDT